MNSPHPLTFGAIEDPSLPLAVLAHGFPDTPFTWRHLGPELAGRGYRVVAPWLPGYDAPTDRPISVGTYVRHLLQVRRDYDGDDRAVLIGHDWGAQAGYGVVASEPTAFSRFVALAVPPVAAMAGGLFTHAQLKRSFYIYFIQQVGMAEVALLAPGFWESLWSDWSPGYDATEDIAELRRHVTADNIANVVGPYRASFNPQFVDPNAEAETLATGPDAVSARCRRRGDRCRPACRPRPVSSGRRIGSRDHRRRRPLPAPGKAGAGRGENR